MYILEKENISADVYIDDFFGAETPEFIADVIFCRIKELFKELHLEAAIDKDVPPTYKMLCLEVMVDALELTLSVPEFRIAELTEELQRWTNYVYCLSVMCSVCWANFLMWLPVCPRADLFWRL